MHFTDLDNATQQNILQLLDNHISVAAAILEQDRCLLPMLVMPDLKQVINLQPEDDNVDVDKAYAHVIDYLKAGTFTYALFSYSTRIGLASGKETDALKIHVFSSSGVDAAFYTPYTLKGLFRKSVLFDKTIFSELKEHIFD